MSDRSTSLHNLGFLLALVILGALGLQLYRSERALLDADAAVRRSLEVITVVQGTLSALQDVETGMRGYVITGEPQFLQPYVQGGTSPARQRPSRRRPSGPAAAHEPGAAAVPRPTIGSCHDAGRCSVRWRRHSSDTEGWVATS